MAEIRFLTDTIKPAQLHGKSFTTTQVIEYINKDLHSLRKKVENLSLAKDHILIGNEFGVSTQVLMSGDATILSSGSLSLANTGVAAGTYGDSTNVAQVTVDAKGRILTAVNVPISGIGSGTVTNVATAGLISGGPITVTGTITTSMSTNRLVGRGTAGTGIMEEITLGTGLALAGTTLNVTTGIPTLAQVLTSGNDADATGLINDDSSVSSIEINERRLNSTTANNYIDWELGTVRTGAGATQIKANFYNGELYDNTNITVDWVGRTLSFGNWTSVVSHTTPILIMTGVTTRNQSTLLADDATYTVLKSAAAGIVNVMSYENTGTASIDGFIQFIFIAYPSSGTGTLTQIAVADGINEATSDTDGFLCAYMTGEDITIKNRLGDSRNIMITIDYF